MQPRYGTFTDDGRAFRITTPRTPRHWYNYLWNERYVALFSQIGQGEALSQDLVGRRIGCLNGRQLFVQDAETGECWNLFSAQVAQSGYACEHGLGYSTITLDCGDLSAAVTVFVPRNDTCELWSLSLTNRSASARNLRLCFVTDPGIGNSAKPQSYFTCQGGYDSTNNTVLVSEPVVREGSASTQYNYLSLSLPVMSFDTRYQSFAGFGSLADPDALRAGGCTQSACAMERTVLAAETLIGLAAGETLRVQAVNGTASDLHQIADARRLLPEAAARAELSAVREQVRGLLGEDAFRTPDATLNVFLGQWLKRQISLGIRWARVRHNGYRDQLQDITAFARIHPAQAKIELHRVLGFQYSSGYAPRTWLDGQIRDNGFSDNHVWIIPAVHALLTETGDVTLLEESVPFNDGSRASLYEHARRAWEYLWNDRGRHGLCRIHEGDWDDCMNLTGKGGEGESVWLAQAWLHANGLLQELARWSGNDADVRLCQERGAVMAADLEQHAYRQEGYYVRAFDDRGEAVGALEDTEARLYLNTQSWAVLAGLPGGRASLQTAAALLDRDLGAVCVLDPYTQWRNNVGFMTIKMAGSQENGGVYLHACAFRLVAECLCGNRETVSTLIRQMLPWGERPGAEECEPYVFCNSYFYMPGTARHGTPGQSWGTGTAGWFYLALLDYVYGLRPEREGLRVQPCLPPEWSACSVTRHFRGATYEVQYLQQGQSGAVREIRVDGAPFAGSHLPCVPGHTHRVEVLLG